LIDIIPRSIGIRFIDAIHWSDSEADIIVWTDASLKMALSFVFNNQGFVYKLCLSSSILVDIFFLELVAILSAIEYIVHLPHPPRRVLLFTDSLDSVAVFNSLSAAEPIHNCVLMGVAGLVMQSGIDVRVRHISGKDNVRADMLSRLLFEDYKLKFPQDRVRTFSPPRDLLPARWREAF
jgi:hypothetical protein